MRNFQGYPYKLSLLIGSVVLAHELVSLIDRVRRLRRPQYDHRRHDFRQDRHSYHSPPEEDYTRTYNPYGKPYDKNDF